MKNIQAMAGGSVGYVRGVFSGRAQGVAFPVDLVRAVVKTAARMVLRRRMAQAFDGYLVTEQGPAVVSMFSKYRACHEQGVDIWACTSERMGLGFNAAGVLSGPIDAPENIAGGGWVKREDIAEGVGIPALLDRAAAFDCGPAAVVVDPLERAFSGRRWMHEFLPLHCAGDHFRDSEFLPWARGIDRGALDAAPYIAAGSVVPLCVLSTGVVLTQTSVIKREALQ